MEIYLLSIQYAAGIYFFIAGYYVNGFIFIFAMKLQDMDIWTDW